MVQGRAKDLCEGPEKDPALLQTFQKDRDLADHILQRKATVYSVGPSSDLD